MGTGSQQEEQYQEAGAAHELPAVVGSTSGREVARLSTEEARACLPFAEAAALKILPLTLLKGESGGVLHCAAGCSDEALRRRVRFATGHEVAISCFAPDAVEDAIIKAYRGSEALLAGRISALGAAAGARPRALPQIPEASGDAAALVMALLEYGAASGASDLHLAPSPSGSLLKVRIDGELLVQDRHQCPAHLHEQVIARLKVLAGLDVTCRRVPQDGAFSFQVGERQHSARLSILPALHGESAVVRLMRARAVPDASGLGLEPAALSALRGALSMAQGIVLLTGPTGSGKTTTMYAAAREVSSSGRNVVTVEDPVEGALTGIVQVRVNEAHGLTYPRALRSVLRHDPDVIVIGEVRDPESARIAIESAATGHLTISSLHVGSALLALRRLASLGVPPELSVPVVSLVVSQRLLPRLCSCCKALDSAGSERAGFEAYRPVGCQACGGSGFEGRAVVSESLDLRSARAKDVCIEHRTCEARARSMPEGALIPWGTGLERLARAGSISLVQVERFMRTEVAL